MIVAIACAARMPAIEAGALLERGIARPDEIGFADTQLAQRLTHRRPGTFAHANRCNVGGLDQDDIDPALAAGVVLRGDDARRNPARGTPADHYDLCYRLTHLQLFMDNVSRSP